MSWSTGCGKEESHDEESQEEKPLDMKGRVRASVGALCEGGEDAELRLHLDLLRQAARDHPELLLPYLRDVRGTMVTTEGPHASNRHPPYPVWREVDRILCEYHGIEEHGSMPVASEYWERFLSGGKK